MPLLYRQMFSADHRSYQQATKLRCSTRDVLEDTGTAYCSSRKVLSWGLEIQASQIPEKAQRARRHADQHIIVLLSDLLWTGLDWTGLDKAKAKTLPMDH